VPSQSDFLLANRLNKPRIRSGSTGQFCLPLAAGAGVAATALTVTSSTTTWTYGSWTTLIASTAAALYIQQVIAQGSTGGFDGQLQIGVGGIGSEAVVATLPILGLGTSAMGAVIDLKDAIPVAAGQRIALRSLTNAASPNNYILAKALCVNQPDIE
jgi:hypothetical protein